MQERARERGRGGGGGAGQGVTERKNEKQNFDHACVSHINSN